MVRRRDLLAPIQPRITGREEMVSLVQRVLDMRRTEDEISGLLDLLARRIETAAVRPNARCSAALRERLRKVGELRQLPNYLIMNG